jgi:Icc-related predicted phosphoesterase
MKFIYATDLHGNHEKFRTILNFAKEYDYKIIHLGSDFLPKNHNILQTQLNFIENFFCKFVKTCGDFGIELFYHWGNDDTLYSLYNAPLMISNKNKAISFIKNYKLISYSYVPDYPFLLKDFCKSDFDNWTHPKYFFGTPEYSDENGFHLIDDISKFFKDRGTIEEDLKNLKVDRNTICSFHCPPYGLDLDVCNDGRRVGSKSIYDWIEKEQPLLVLSGHIHENYEMTKTWKNYIKNTLVIQPGQRGACRFVIIEIKGDEIESSLVEI